jgi:hypothetical protein
MFIVTVAAWLLLTTSNENLNAITNGGQASEQARAALNVFADDMTRAKLTPGMASPILTAETRRVQFLCDTDRPADGLPELVTWAANDASATLVRTVTRPPAGYTSTQILAMSTAAAFTGTSTAQVVVEGLATSAQMSTPTLFSYGVSAKNLDWQSTPGRIGMVFVHLRNGMPTNTQNVIDRTQSFRVLAYVINGYPGE